MTSNRVPTYTVTIRQDGREVGRHEGLRDPFHHTTVRMRGLRSAWRVLIGRSEIVVSVDSDPLTVERVMHLNPDYLPLHGQRRDEFQSQLQEALSAVGRPL